MKRLFCALLCAVLVISLIGCKRDEPIKDSTAATAPAVTQTVPPATTVPADTTIAAPLPELPFAAVSVTPAVESEILSDGTLLFEYTYPSISLFLPDGDIAETILLDFLNRVDATRPEAENILSDAGEYYTGNPDWNKYFYTLTYSPMRIDTGVLSLYGLETSYIGGNHPNHNACAINYDLTTGKAMKLRDILVEGTTADALVRLVCDSLAGQEDSLFSDYAYCVEDRFAGDFGADTLWYLSAQGLCFFFSPYEIGPYTAGTIVAEIPYELLSDILQDAYFPGETVSANGSLFGQYFDQISGSEMDHYSHFAEVTLDADGTDLLLSTDEIIYQVKIESGSWNENHTEFTAHQTVFASNVLTRDDAIWVTVDPDNTENLCISYQSMDENRRCYPEEQNGVLTIVSDATVHN